MKTQCGQKYIEKYIYIYTYATRQKKNHPMNDKNVFQPFLMYWIHIYKQYAKPITYMHFLVLTCDSGLLSLLKGIGCFQPVAIMALWTSWCRFLSLSSESILWATCSKWPGSGTRTVDTSHYCSVSNRSPENLSQITEHICFSQLCQ